MLNSVIWNMDYNYEVVTLYFLIDWILLSGRLWFQILYEAAYLE
jgi:hypothetical protein